MRRVQPGHLLTSAALSAVLGNAMMARATDGDSSTFTVHGTLRTCSAIWQLDSALAANYREFFSTWTLKDYTDAVVWAESCADYGWHVPGRSRVPLLMEQRNQAFAPALTSTASRAVEGSLPESTLAKANVTPHRQQIWSATHELPADGSAIIGYDATIKSHHADTLPDIARRYGLGYEEIRRANPGVDVWLPGEGTRILLPGRHRLPSGSRQGVVVNLAERRLYFFPKPNPNDKPIVVTYPVSIGKLGSSTPLGESVIIEKVQHPSWHPPTSVRKEHAQQGEWLPPVVGPGPDNPLGDYMMRLGFGDGSYEIHGTNKPVSVGMDSTFGCIGMYPEDVAALFESVAVGTPVRFVDTPL